MAWTTAEILNIVLAKETLVTRDIRHRHLHYGEMFTTHVDNSVTSSGDMTVIAFNTPAAGDIHIWFSGTASHAADLYLYEDTSIDVDEGVTLSTVNRRRTTPIPTSTLSTIETTPTVGSVSYFLEAAADDANITTTNELDHAPIIGGAGPRALGATTNEHFGYILALNQQYAIVIEAGTADAATHTLKLLWTEG
jgi:hypothetical protein